MPHPYDAGKTIEISLRRMDAAKAAHYLTVIQGVTVRRAVPIAAEPLTLGRDPSRPFFLPDADVSRSHCSLRLAGDVVLVSDLGSTNGTFVDGVRVTAERPFPVGSLLQVGRHALKHELLRPDEVAQLEQLANELERARGYVKALIPAPLASGALRVDWCYVPSSILGGDALGYHELPGGRLALYVIDVCGHGVASAMHSASVLNALRSQTLPNADFGEPSQVLERLNEAFRMDEHDGMYCTVFYGVVDPKAGRVKFATAGHPPALVLGGDGGIRQRLSTKNPPVGTFDRRTFTQSEAPFGPGERLYAFSDGVYEIVDRDGRDRDLEDFENDLLASTALRGPGESRRIFEAACAAAGIDVPQDDFTLVVVEHATSAT